MASTGAGSSGRSRFPSWICSGLKKSAPALWTSATTSSLKSKCQHTTKFGVAGVVGMLPYLVSLQVSDAVTICSLGWLLILSAVLPAPSPQVHECHAMSATSCQLQSFVCMQLLVPFLTADGPHMHVGLLNASQFLGICSAELDCFGAV